MNRSVLVGYFLFVLAALLAATVAASLDRSVLSAAAEIWADPWGRATIADAYFAFLAVWLWVAWRERTWTTRIAWLVGFLVLGNFAIAAYFLRALGGARSKAPLDDLFGTRPEESR